MRRPLIALAALLALCVPAAHAAPPADKGKPGASAAAPGQSEEKNAAKRCKAERERIGSQAFATKYGTNANKANAFGKCVSSQEKKDDDEDKDEADAQDEAKENAAKRCKAERARIGLEAFRAKYGTNPNKANAFGKCVSKLVKKSMTA